MAPGWLYAGRVGWRHRWRGLLALGLAIGVGCGAVLAVAAAYRRTDTAYDRLADESLRYDVSIQDDADGAPTVDASADLPGVIAHDRIHLFFGFVGEEQILVVGGSGGDFGYRMDRPVVSDGRLPDPDADDEIVVNEQSAASFDLEVGDTLTAGTLTVEQFERAMFQGADPGAPAGPQLELEVVGIGKIPDDLDAPDAASIVPPGVVADLVGRAGGFDNTARVRLEDPGRADAFVDALADLPGYQRELVYVGRGADDGRRVADGIGVEAVSTALLAAAAALALGFVVVLVIARQTVTPASQQRSLAACGLDRRGRAAAIATPYFLVAAVAAASAIPVALALSTIFPIGLAGDAEPAPGLDADLTVFAVGAGAAALLVVGVSALAAWRTARSVSADLAPRRGRARRSMAGAVAGGTPLGPAGTIGVHLALEPGHGDIAVPARSALLSVAVGVAGVAAVLVFAASLDRLVETPRLYGFQWDFTVSATDDPALDGAIEEHLHGDDRVDGFAFSDVRTVEVGGEDLNVAALAPRQGDVTPVVLDGRLPSSPTEVSLGPLDQRDLGVGVGDELELPGDDGPIRAEVVGTTFVPVDDDESGRGAVMTPEGLRRMSRSGGFRAYLVDVAPGVPPESVMSDLEAESEVSTAPTSVDNLQRARGVPRLLAGFLVVLAVAGVAHALAVTVRRRRLDLWTLRAIGFRRSQLRALSEWQAATIAVVGLVVGLPLGIAAGRAVWREIADRIGVVPDPAPASSALLAAAAAAVLVLVVVGTIAGWLSARLVVTRPPRHE